MRLEVGTDLDREALAAERALEWRGRLTEGEFLARNRRLYLHPFGRTRVQTWIWRKENRILSSLDTISIQLQWHELVREAWLIASVVTPKACRGSGYASQLITALLASQPERSALLFSDIDPAFYQRFGFRLTAHEEVEILSASGSGGPLRSMRQAHVRG